MRITPSATILLLIDVCFTAGSNRTKQQFTTHNFRNIKRHKNHKSQKNEQFPLATTCKFSQTHLTVARQKHWPGGCHTLLDTFNMCAVAQAVCLVGGGGTDGWVGTVLIHSDWIWMPDWFWGLSMGRRQTFLLYTYPLTLGHLPVAHTQLPYIALFCSYTCTAQHRREKTVLEKEISIKHVIKP